MFKVDEDPNESFAFAPLSSQFISSNAGAALGARPLRTSLNLSIAVPIGVDAAKSVKRPSE